MAQEIYIQAGGLPRPPQKAGFQPSEQSYGRLVNAKAPQKSRGFRVPGYLPYRRPLRNVGMWVPNQQSVDWPQAQLAPEFFPPGSSSVQPFVYPNFQEARVFSYDQYIDPKSGQVDNYQTPAQYQGLGGLYEEAEENPFIATLNVTGLLWLAGAGVLGYYTAKKGWDHKLRAFVKSKL